MNLRRQAHSLHTGQAVSQPGLADSDVVATALTRVRAAATHLGAMQAALAELARLSGAQHAVLLIQAANGERLYPRLACRGAPGQPYEIVAPALVLGGAELNWPQAEASARSIMPSSFALKMHGRSVGAVWLDRIVYFGSQARQKRAAIDALVHQLALIVENGELHRQLEERQEWLNMLAAAGQISQQLNAGRDAERTLVELQDACRFLLDAERCSIWVVDWKTQTLSVLSQNSDRPGVALGDGIAGWVVSTGQPALAPDVTRDPRHNAALDAALGFKTQQLMCVPLAVTGRLLGAIEVANKQSGSFDELDVGLLQMLAPSAANALNTTQAQAQARRADYDPLTQVPNRALFGERLEQAVKRAQQPGGRQFAVLFVDIDRFKAVNDSLGHLAGDQLLVTIAQRLAGCLRSKDTIARFGGDEFTILLEDVADLGAARRVAERIQREFARPFDLEGRERRVGVSIGIALSAAGYERPEDLLRDADRVMYRVKSLGEAREAAPSSAQDARA